MPSLNTNQYHFCPERRIPSHITAAATRCQSPHSTTPSSCPDSRTGVDTANVKIMSMNPFCEIAVEEALRLREAGAASEVVAATVGPAQVADTLRTALAMGADRAVHVLHDPDPDAARPLLPLAVAKILRALALQETPGLLILGKQCRNGQLESSL
ncbi:electron transfer flavoprotein subunit beta, mitochondrial-like [Triticum aestivum]|uniref:electron transfer flavoprotein subunit beta, mitochondrial-like n=1 Tax=Triticum aestivum TaxID=4565 RepID=UPI001D0252F0|nr:electron transfer flavoprotein subunit beta, mitochondrial-like [Triticum aestivum]